MSTSSCRYRQRWRSPRLSSLSRADHLCGYIETFPEHRNFAWQEGYGAFSLDIALVERTTCYINSQAEHHRKQTFQEEFLAFLKRHNMEYDERYIWD